MFFFFFNRSECWKIKGENHVENFMKFFCLFDIYSLHTQKQQTFFKKLCVKYIIVNSQNNVLKKVIHAKL